MEWVNDKQNLCLAQGNSGKTHTIHFDGVKE